jgi:hypothetical protein
MNEQTALSSRPVRRDPEAHGKVTGLDVMARRSEHPPTRRFGSLRWLRAELVALCSELSAAVLVDPKGKK